MYIQYNMLSSLSVTYSTRSLNHRNYLHLKCLVNSVFIVRMTLSDSQTTTFSFYTNSDLQPSTEITFILNSQLNCCTNMSRINLLCCLLNKHIYNIETFSKNSIFNENFLIDCERRYYKWFQIGMFNHVFNIDIFSTNIQYFINISNINCGGGWTRTTSLRENRFTVCAATNYRLRPQFIVVCLSYIFNIETIY